MWSNKKQTKQNMTLNSAKFNRLRNFLRTSTPSIGVFDWISSKWLSINDLRMLFFLSSIYIKILLNFKKNFQFTIFSRETIQLIFSWLGISDIILIEFDSINCQKCRNDERAPNDHSRQCVPDCHWSEIDENGEKKITHTVSVTHTQFHRIKVQKFWGTKRKEKFQHQNESVNDCTTNHPVSDPTKRWVKNWIKWKTVELDFWVANCGKSNH